MGEKLKKAADELERAFINFCVVAVEETDSPAGAVATVAMSVDGCFHHFMASVAQTASAIKEGGAK